MLRDCKDLAITKAILHVMDINGDGPILGRNLINLDEETYMYIYNHIQKIVKNGANLVGVFNMASKTKGMIEDALKGNFESASEEIGNNLFEIMKKTPDAPSGDLVVVELVSDGKKGIGLLLLEYKTQFVHDIKYEDGEIDVSLKPQTTGLPNKSQKLSKFAFMTESSTPWGYELLLMEKTSKDENGEKVEYWIKSFLSADIILDGLDATRVLRNRLESWMRKNLKEDIVAAIEKRQIIDEAYLNKKTIKPIELIREVIGSKEEENKFVFKILKAGVDAEKEYEIDKDWVENVLKSKKYKTDTGFEVKGDFDIFDDTSRFEINYNNDGTVNILLKGVRNINQG